MKCPKCGTTMCEQFDDKVVKGMTLAVPNGTFVCFRCNSKPLPPKPTESDEPHSDTAERAREWWAKHQDDFVTEVRGTGLYAHSLYDVEAALAAFGATFDAALEMAERTRKQTIKVWKERATSKSCDAPHSEAIKTAPRIEQLESIVRSVSMCAPTKKIRGKWICSLCEASSASVNNFEHYTDCPFRRSRELHP